MLRNIFAVFAAVVFASVAAGQVRTYPVPGRVPPPAAVERRVFELVNLERTTRGLRQLSLVRPLILASREHSANMVRYDFFDHRDHTGRDIRRRTELAGYSNEHRVAENLFRTSGRSDIAETAVRMWMRSAGHRKNILDPRLTLTGIGVHAAADGDIFITQLFIGDR